MVSRVLLPEPPGAITATIEPSPAGRRQPAHAPRRSVQTPVLNHRCVVWYCWPATASSRVVPTPSNCWQHRPRRYPAAGPSGWPMRELVRSIRFAGPWRSLMSQPMNHPIRRRTRSFREPSPADRSQGLAVGLPGRRGRSRDPVCRVRPEGTYEPVPTDALIDWCNQYGSQDRGNLEDERHSRVADVPISHAARQLGQDGSQPSGSPDRC
jgi:hypothetical protein